MRVPNPNAPRITAGRLADALVYLVGIDPARSAPWPGAQMPASVEVTRTALVVERGGRAGRVAVVRRGQDVEFVAREEVDPATSQPVLHSVRGRGAAFFTQMLPAANRPVSRPMSTTGVVELSSGSAYYWLRGYLYVSDDPYAADGKYEAVCWVPDWHVERRENDPEWTGPVRLFFGRAAERRQRVTVETGRVVDVDFILSDGDFGRGIQPP
jgi:hypothetical protein